MPEFDMPPTLAALGAFLIAAAVSYFLAPVVIRFAHRVDALDHPEPSGRKKHDKPTPHLGSIAVFAGFVAGCMFLLATSGPDPFLSIPRVGSKPSFLIAVALGLIIGAMGTVDDLRPLPASFRLAVQIAAAAAAWQFGFKVLASPWPAVNLALTIAWIVGITNAFNLLDNMDGLSSGLAAIGAFSFAGMALLGSLSSLAVTAAALSGAALGFLPRNRFPARIFVGDGGALFYGFMLALIGIEIKFDNLVSVTFLVPVVVLGLPILDTTLVVVSRIRRKKPPFTGARDHVSHRLVQVGLPVKTAVALLYWAALCLGWLGLVISRSTVQVGFMLLGFVIAVGLFFALLLARVPVDDHGS